MLYHLLVSSSLRILDWVNHYNDIGNDIRLLAIQPMPGFSTTSLKFTRFQTIEFLNYPYAPFLFPESPFHNFLPDILETPSLQENVIIVFLPLVDQGPLFQVVSVSNDGMLKLTLSLKSSDKILQIPVDSDLVQSITDFITIVQTHSD